MLAFSAACTTSAPLYTPRVDFPERSPEIVEKAILERLHSRQWISQKNGPGEILGTLNVRNHQATILINYNGSAYSIRHWHSNRLGYRLSRPAPYPKGSVGSELIHRNYNAWVRELVNDINTALAVPIKN